MVTLVVVHVHRVCSCTKNLHSKQYNQQILKMLESPVVNLTHYGCTKCSYQGVYSFQLDYHIQRIHKNVDSVELFHVIATPELYSCFCCDYKSRGKLGLYEHCISKHYAATTVENKNNDQFPKEFKSWPCDFCKYESNSSLCLVEHQDSCKMEFKDPIEIVTLPVKHIIKKNDFSLRRTSKQYKKKIPASAKITRFSCTKCSYQAKQKGTLKIHMAQHAAPDELEILYCDKCSYRCNQARNLKRHMLAHTSHDHIKKWFNCTKCSFRTKRSSNLSNHMLTHATVDQIAWFDCGECPYRAKYKGNLKRHMLSHASISDDIKLFSCTECFYQTKRNDHLKHHMLTHASPDEINWFDCTKCSFRTKQRSYLKEHLRIHARAEEMGVV